MRFVSFLLGASALLVPAAAQTWTACNPMNTTCPNDPALGTSHNFVFNTSSGVTDTFNITAGTPTYNSSGVGLTVAKQGGSTTIQSQWYFFFGTVSVMMKAAPGQGIISSIVLESDDLDEVDWEFMGSNVTTATSNYFGKGNTTSYDRGGFHPVSSDIRENYHNYTLDWSAERLIWIIDGVEVRTLLYEDAYGGKDYPQTPMTLRIGIWAGGDPSNSIGTIEWAGGPTDFTQCPYTMYVQSAEVHDASTGSAYQWTDKTGDWQSIKAITGNSTAAQTIIKSATLMPSTSLAQKFQALPATTKIAVYACAGAAGALLFGAFLFTFMRQRKRGRLEREAYNAKVEQEREDAFKEHVELREKGLGGWSNPTSPTAAAPQSTLLGDVPIRANQWNGGNNGGLIHDAHGAYNGGYAGVSGPLSPTFPAGQVIGSGITKGGYQRF